MRLFCRSFKVSKEPQVQIEILWHFFRWAKTKIRFSERKKFMVINWDFYDTHKH